MPMVKFTLSDGIPIWIDPDKVVAVHRRERVTGIHIDVDSYWSVDEEVEDVVAKIEEAKER